MIYFLIQNFDISVYSIAGRKVMSFKNVFAEDRYAFNIRALACGVYQLVCDHEGETLKKTFFVYR